MQDGLAECLVDHDFFHLGGWAIDGPIRRKLGLALLLHAAGGLEASFEVVSTVLLQAHLPSPFLALVQVDHVEARPEPALPQHDQPLLLLLQLYLSLHAHSCAPRHHLFSTEMQNRNA